jgi:hypothetical protein
MRSGSPERNSGRNECAGDLLRHGRSPACEEARRVATLVENYRHDLVIGHYGLKAVWSRALGMAPVVRRQVALVASGRDDPARSKGREFGGAPRLPTDPSQTLAPSCAVQPAGLGRGSGGDFGDDPGIPSTYAAVRLNAVRRERPQRSLPGQLVLAAAG